MLFRSSLLWRILTSVSLYSKSVWPGFCLLIQNKTLGGTFEAIVNALYGAKLTNPVGDNVDIQAIGLGTIHPVSNLYESILVRLSLDTLI